MTKCYTTILHYDVSRLITSVLSFPLLFFCVSEDKEEWKMKRRTKRRKKKRKKKKSNGNDNTLVINRETS